jgi:Fur family ferric uptake transcriptional regulator
MATHSIPAITRLKEAGHRITKPRRALIEVMRKLKGPAAPEEICEKLKARGESIDLVTVYRNMEALERLGLVRRVFLTTGKAFFCYTEALSEYFVVRKDAAEFEALDFELCAEIEEAAKKIEATLKRAGFTEVSHTVQFVALPKRNEIGEG